MRQAELGSLLANYFDLGMAGEPCSLQIVRAHLSTQVFSVSFVKHHCSALPLELYRRAKRELWPQWHCAAGARKWWDRGEGRKSSRTVLSQEPEASHVVC